MDLFNSQFFTKLLDDTIRDMVVRTLNKELKAFVLLNHSEKIMSAESLNVLTDIVVKNSDLTGVRSISSHGIPLTIWDHFGSDTLVYFYKCIPSMKLWGYDID